MSRLVILFLCIFLWTNKSIAQRFMKSQQSVVQATQILIDNYTTVPLCTEKQEAAYLNVFDQSNPYTYIQNLTDADEKIYQILFQTDFWGKLYLLAISNNLAEIFNLSGKPMFRFMSCIKEVNASDFPTEDIDKAVNCILERLNYCRE